MIVQINNLLISYIWLYTFINFIITRTTHADKKPQLELSLVEHIPPARSKIPLKFSQAALKLHSCLHFIHQDPQIIPRENSNANVETGPKLCKEDSEKRNFLDLHPLTHSTSFHQVSGKSVKLFLCNLAYKQMYDGRSCSVGHYFSWCIMGNNECTTQNFIKHSDTTTKWQTHYKVNIVISEWFGTRSIVYRVLRQRKSKRAGDCGSRGWGRSPWWGEKKRKNKHRETNIVE